mmetsp:Transcript_13207/g.38285  ORF Transcript_13207/g.38285 Transcript_13207/m.38285 type:complete len:217 (-) Transcript_13207:641-1291(-)
MGRCLAMLCLAIDVKLVLLDQRLNEVRMGLGHCPVQDVAAVSIDGTHVVPVLFGQDFQDSKRSSHRGKHRRSMSRDVPNVRIEPKLVHQVLDARHTAGRRRRMHRRLTPVVDDVWIHAQRSTNETKCIDATRDRRKVRQRVSVLVHAGHAQRVYSVPNDEVLDDGRVPVDGGRAQRRVNASTGRRIEVSAVLPDERVNHLQRTPRRGERGENVGRI